MELALAADDAVRNVVAIAEDDCRPRFHGELLWRESEIIDIHLGTCGDRGQGQSDAESGGGKNKAQTQAPHAGVVRFGQVAHVGFLLRSWFSWRQAVYR